MDPRTFRQPSCVMIVGGLIAIVGSITSGVAGYHMATGTPMMQGTSKFNGGEHVASSSELWVGTLGGIPFLIFGLAMILSILNCGVTIDDEGVTATNLFKRRTFRAAWPEITDLKKVGPPASPGYKVVANGKTLHLTSSYVHLKELAAEIQKHAPNLPKA